MKKVRCAIYCRKSSEEGLEQEFNSLHAQREACAAYISSQKHEGWELIPDDYSDGGFSGGNMERPALKKLISDIEANKIDVIVVYKIDRLSRSIADFMKMVEVFEKRSVAFVSVTQSFNTQNSMGKLMLNILLSFAQFEREVTGERIRDKIAASKKKGMWMGGTIPLGYDLKDRKLLVNEAEANVIRHIYKLYIELKSVNLLKAELDNQGYMTKGRNGQPKKFSKGHLYHMLQNRLYLGEINHKDKCYPGEHEAIITPELYQQVQDNLKQSRVKRSMAKGAKSPCLLTGKLFDDKGNYMSPKHSRTRKRHYRYYTSQAIIQGKHSEAGSLPNIPAREIEVVVQDELIKLLKDDSQLQKWLHDRNLTEQTALLSEAKKIAEEILIDPGKLKLLILSTVAKIAISAEDVTIEVSTYGLLSFLGNSSEQIEGAKQLANIITIKRQIKLGVINNGSKVIIGKISSGCNMQLVKAIARSFLWHEQLITGEVSSQIEIMKRQSMKSMAYIEKIMKLRFLPPEYIESILLGTQPADWTIEGLLSVGI